MLFFEYLNIFNSSSSFGIFGGGWSGHSFDVTDKYTYSSDGVVGGTALSTPTHELAATGTSTVGIFGGGYSSQSATIIIATDRHTYARDSVAGGTSLGTARLLLAATGNPTVGIFGGGS